MKKLSEYRDEEALDLLADILEPAVAIMQDAGFSDAIRDGRTARAVKLAIKNHKPEVLEILARLDGVPVSEYHCSVITLPVKVLEILNDPATMDAMTAVFTSPEAETTSPSGSSGSPMEIIPGGAP